MSLDNSQLAKLAASAGIAAPTTKQRVEDVVAATLTTLQQQGLKSSVTKYYAENRLLVMPNLDYSLKGSVAGRARHNGRQGTLMINLAYINEPDYLEQTVPHEVCHIACFQWWPDEAIYHGFKWKLLMHLLGLNPDRCHTYEVVRARKTKKFIYSCNCPERKFTLGATRHKRHQSVTQYYCPDCKQFLQFTGEIIS